MTDRMPNILFRMMPQAEGMLSYGGKLLLYDNLDKPIMETVTDDVRAFIGGMPKKVYFTLVLLCTNGEVKMRCNLQDYSIGSGGLLVIVPNTIVESLDISADANLVVFAFSDDSYAPSMAFYDAAYARTRFVAPLALHVENDIISETIAAYRHLRHALEHFGGRVSEDLVKAYMQVMSGLIAVGIKNWESSAPAKEQSSQEKIVAAFLSRVAADFDRYRDVTHYAEAACLSPKYFAKVIFHATGKHPADWIADHVILEAKTMLRSGYTIQQTCDALHFQTQSHFGRYFKSATGMTPKQYKNAR